jgi:hypothetical protein
MVQSSHDANKTNQGEAMSEWRKPSKEPNKFVKFLWHNNFWFWSVLCSLIFIGVYSICLSCNYNFVDGEVARTFISGQFAIIGFVLTVAAFVFSSKVGMILMKNKPHGKTFFLILVFTSIYCLISIIGYMFTGYALLVYVFTIAALTNILVSFYYLYFTLKNFAERPDATP